MRWLVFSIILVIGTLIFRPIISNVWYPMHDNTQITRTYLLDSTLRSGQFPAIWAHELDMGRGYPLFHFYAPLYYYVSLGASYLTGSYFSGLKLSLFVSSLLGMVGVYFLARRWGRGAGIVSAAAYGLLPYAAVNLYVRGAMAEYLSMGILPWIFYTWEHLSSRREQLLAAVVTTLFILSHNLIPILTFPVIIIWILINHYSSLTKLVLPFLLTLGLSAFFVLPLVFERHFVQADQIAQTTNYSLHFVAPSQLWNSLWGYGGSAAGVEDGMSFKVGKLHLLLALAGCVLAVYRRSSYPILFALFGIFSLYMTMSYSSLLWSSIPVLPLIQFPWRFLALAGLFISLLAGYSVTAIRHPVLQMISSILFVSVLVILNLKLFVPQQTFPAQLEAYVSSSFLSTIPEIVPEFAPVWLAQDNHSPSEATILPYNYYPTWRVLVDGVALTTLPSQTGLLAVINPTNSTDLTVVQSHTLLEKIALMISSVTLLIVVFIIRQTHVKT